MSNKIIHHGKGIIEAQGKHKRSWGIDSRFNGKRVRRVGLLSRAEAEDALADIEDGVEPKRDRVTGCGMLKVGGIGATAELLVCADLLMQGYDVFRSVSINAACDVIAADKDGQLCRIEVKSAIHRGNQTRFKRHRFDSSKHDILALVFLREQSILYSEPIDLWFEDVRVKPKYNVG